MRSSSRFITFFLILTGIFFTRLPFAIAQENSTEDRNKDLPLTRILFVLDASQSMSGTWESDEKMNIAREILTELVDSLQYVENVQMALRVYGHQSPVPPQDCNDTRLEVPFAPENAGRIRQKLNSISPKGTTPIANSLAMTVNDFPPCSNCRNIILLITDGIEACDGDPCAVSRELQQKSIVLRPFVIGIGIDPGFRETFECVGYYYNAREEITFKQTMGFVINQVLNSTTAQVNLLDKKGNPTETDVNMSFYENFSGKLLFNVIHTMNEKGNPDTLELDHLMTYRLKVHTLPPVEVDSIIIEPGKHTTIPVNVPQGYLNVKTNQGRDHNGLKFIVRIHDKHETLNNQAIGSVEKYLIGKYDLEIPTIPRINLENIEILQGHTTTIDIPEPARITFASRSPGVGSLYLLLDGDQQWIMNLDSSVRQQDYNIQPGRYRVVFRNASEKKMRLTTVTDFKVDPGKAAVINLY
ncbi:MAG: vWA domain-containing protein [Bacteroidales bacterium]